MTETFNRGRGAQRALPIPGDVHLWHGRPAPVRVVRGVLAPYLGLPQDKVVLAKGKFGKPELPGRPLHFSKANTRYRTLVAVTRDAPVGIDIERVRPVADVIGLAAKAFGAEAAVALASLPRAPRDRAFLQAWTRLEAAIKANGASLGRDAARYKVVWSPDAEPAIQSIDGDRQSALRFDMQDLDLGPDHVGAIAVLGRIDRIVDFAFEPAAAARAAA